MKKVLIVEDERSLSRALHDAFVREGFQPLVAHNGEEGIAIATKEHPDIILLDLAMPKKTGIEMLQELRESAWGEYVPVVVLTNLPADSKDVVKGIIEAKPEYYLVKANWGIKDIVEKTREILDS